jgi:hypothetical protein
MVQFRGKCEFPNTYHNIHRKVSRVLQFNSLCTNPPGEVTQASMHSKQVTFP